MKDLFLQLSDFERITFGSNIVELLKYYQELNHDFSTLINSINNDKEKWTYSGDLESKLFRIYLTNESISKIAEGHLIPSKKN